MKLIIWLWNPWEKYKDTRHNLGFILLDKCQYEFNFSLWKYESKFMADISLGTIADEKFLLVKPQTFMNISGESIKKICNFYKIWIWEFIVIYDDMSMPFWKIRLREKWSAGWHNGVKSIIQYFWNQWYRIKVWIWFDDRYEVSDWVLSKFSAQERIDIDNEIYKKISELLKKK
jgi:PTH1 family peptidyl-tRNA hydrolase